MKYKYYFSAIQCDRLTCDFIRACDLGIEEYGVRVTISFTTDTKPTKKNIAKLENLLGKSKEEKSLKSYFTLVKFERAEIKV